MRQKGNKEITLRADGSKRVVTVNNEPTRTQTQYKDEVNVNNIIAKFRKTGSITHIRNAQTGVYSDLTEMPDLFQAQQTVLAAETAFAAVPSHIRARFGNSPTAFIEFLSDKNNDEEAIKLGLKVKKEPPKPDPVVEEIRTLGKLFKSSSRTEKS